MFVVEVIMVEMMALMVMMKMEIAIVLMVTIDDYNGDDGDANGEDIDDEIGDKIYSGMVELLKFKYIFTFVFKLLKKTQLFLLHSAQTAQPVQTLNGRNRSGD